MQNRPDALLPLAYPVNSLTLLQQFKQYCTSTQKESSYLCEIIALGKNCSTIKIQLEEWLKNPTSSQFSITGLVLN